MEEKKKLSPEELEKKGKFYATVIIVFLIAIFIIWFNITTSSNSNNVNNSSATQTSEPDDATIVAYAQGFLRDYLINPQYEYGTYNYNIIKTLKRYKIEGKVNNENFWMIIEFTDDNYQEYQLISLQIGNEIIYKK